MSKPLSDIFYHTARGRLPDWIVVSSILAGAKADGNGDDRLHWTVCGARGEVLEVNLRPEVAAELLHALAAEIGYEVIKRPEG